MWLIRLINMCNQHMEWEDVAWTFVFCFLGIHRKLKHIDCCLKKQGHYTEINHKNKRNKTKNYGIEDCCRSCGAASNVLIHL